MILEKIREEVSYFSEKAGDVNQKLALAGIAIVWLFRETSNNEIVLDLYLVLGLACFVGSLAFDLIHYAVFAPIYRNYYIKNMTKEEDDEIIEISESVEVGQPFKTNDLSWVFFFCKIGFVIIGYILLGIGILKNISWA